VRQALVLGDGHYWPICEHGLITEHVVESLSVRVRHGPNRESAMVIPLVDFQDHLDDPYWGNKMVVAWVERIHQYERGGQ
jgi:hypothetical protein